MAYFHRVYHAIFKYSCIAIGLVHHVAKFPRLNTASVLEDGGGESSVEVRDSGLGCLDKGMEWFLGGECGDYPRAKACSVGKDSRLTSRSRRGRPRSDTMKSALGHVM